VACILVLAASVGMGGEATRAQPMAAALAVASCPSGSTVNVVAHPDDDLLFLSPGLPRDIAAGRCVTTVFATSGDAGRGTAYSRERELGMLAAYAHMAQVADAWTQTTATSGVRTVMVATLDAQPRIQLVFLRLPDGFLAGGGSDASGGTSLQQLYEGTIDVLPTVDEPSQTYTSAELIQTLGSVMTSAGATSVRTLDQLGDFGDGDHSDHHAIGRLTFLAQQEHAPSASIEGYVGYPVIQLPHNVSGVDLTAKEETFFVYAPYDAGVCQSREQCRDRPEAGYLPREYAASALADASLSEFSDLSGNIAPAARCC
jgi:LmbE family N-acetylglucosaminyl deacetylase